MRKDIEAFAKTKFKKESLKKIEDFLSTL